MRSWLSSPTVQLMGLVASVLTFVQFGVTAWKWLTRQAHGAKDKSDRIYRALSVVGFGVLTVMAPLTWSAIIAVAEKYGQTHWEAFGYPLISNGCCVSGLLSLSLARRERVTQRPWWPGAMTIFGFGSEAAFYFASNGAAWERYALAAIPGVVIALTIWAVLAHATAEVAGRSAPESQQAAASRS